MDTQESLFKVGYTGFRRDQRQGVWTWFRIYGFEVRLRTVIQHPREASRRKGLVQGAITDH